MYAISFDMNTEVLKTTYNPNYNNAYYEIQNILKDYGFERIQGSVYINTSDTPNNLSLVYQAIEKLKNTHWFKESVTDIRVFRAEDWSDFTRIVKE
ncbi:endoribonuclease VapD (plasmid) [Helicobacter cinaedi]|uniref:virulence protein n=1 Tax=Helicobacter cinaedi TaxID=213 RepID=UPI001F28AECF|nr:virulence protein [Helicobacter cinaedi]BDB65814.1 endoribonuclease VapD [Helicobacter cinaedi]